MDFLTIKAASDLWNLSSRRITKLCEEGRIDGAKKISGIWILPPNAEKPKDARIKSGKYVNARNRKSNKGL